MSADPAAAAGTAAGSVASQGGGGAAAAAAVGGGGKGAGDAGGGDTFFNRPDLGGHDQDANEQVKGGCALLPPNLVRYWSRAGQILVKHWSNTRIGK